MTSKNNAPSRERTDMLENGTRLVCDRCNRKGRFYIAEHIKQSKEKDGFVVGRNKDEILMHLCDWCCVLTDDSRFILEKEDERKQEGQ